MAQSKVREFSHSKMVDLSSSLCNKRNQRVHPISIPFDHHKIPWNGHFPCFSLADFHLAPRTQLPLPLPTTTAFPWWWRTSGQPRRRDLGKNPWKSRGKWWKLVENGGKWWKTDGKTIAEIKHSLGFGGTYRISMDMDDILEELHFSDEGHAWWASKSCRYRRSNLASSRIFRLAKFHDRRLFDICRTRMIFRWKSGLQRLFPWFSHGVFMVFWCKWWMLSQKFRSKFTAMGWWRLILKLNSESWKGLNFFNSDFREAKRFVIVTGFFFFSDLGSDFGGQRKPILSDFHTLSEGCISTGGCGSRLGLVWDLSEMSWMLMDFSTPYFARYKWCGQNKILSQLDYQWWYKITIPYIHCISLYVR